MTKASKEFAYDAHLFPTRQGYKIIVKKKLAWLHCNNVTVLWCLMNERNIFQSNKNMPCIGNEWDMQVMPSVLKIFLPIQFWGYCWSCGWWHTDAKPDWHWVLMGREDRPLFIVWSLISLSTARQCKLLLDLPLNLTFQRFMKIRQVNKLHFQLHYSLLRQRKLCLIFSYLFVN